MYSMDFRAIPLRIVPTTVSTKCIRVQSILATMFLRTMRNAVVQVEKIVSNIKRGRDRSEKGGQIGS